MIHDANRKDECRPVPAPPATRLLQAYRVLAVLVVLLAPVALALIIISKVLDLLVSVLALISRIRFIPRLALANGVAAPRAPAPVLLVSTECHILLTPTGYHPVRASRLARQARGTTSDTRRPVLMGLRVFLVDRVAPVALEVQVPPVPLALPLLALPAHRAHRVRQVHLVRVQGVLHSRMRSRLLLVLAPVSPLARINRSQSVLPRLRSLSLQASHQLSPQHLVPPHLLHQSTRSPRLPKSRRRRIHCQNLLPLGLRLMLMRNPSRPVPRATESHLLYQFLQPYSPRRHLRLPLQPQLLRRTKTPPTARTLPA